MVRLVAFLIKIGRRAIPCVAGCAGSGAIAETLPSAGLAVIMCVCGFGRVIGPSRSVSSDIAMVSFHESGELTTSTPVCIVEVVHRDSE
jgi:hypothetical protein